MGEAQPREKELAPIGSGHMAHALTSHYLYFALLYLYLELCTSIYICTCICICICIVFVGAWLFRLRINYFANRRQLYIVGCEVFQFLFITSKPWKSLSSFLHLTAACYWGSGQVAPSFSQPKVPPLSFMAQVTTMSVTSLVLSSSHFLQLSTPPSPQFQGSLTAERAEEHTAWHLLSSIDITKPTVGSSYNVQWLIHDPKHWDGGIKM